ncbi:hypothetical protein Scep_027451 [Stephania cephalantha]|uniref:Uncharacterized protein n=1 Tax=Stephania cephalantha TaxID=152367 RepID=A0AAP0E846_9MAGN
MVKSTRISDDDLPIHNPANRLYKLMTICANLQVLHHQNPLPYLSVQKTKCNSQSLTMNPCTCNTLMFS